MARSFARVHDLCVSPTRAESGKHEEDAGGASAGTDDELVAKGVEHLQAAATEMIAAARAFLDVAEGIVGDPDRLATISDVVVDLARGASRAVADETGQKGTTAPRATAVEHIRVG